MNPLSLENIDLNNTEFQDAWNLIKNTHRSVFLTGKAGTGKSTFLKYICKETEKKYVVLAPTGIAAVNVGGMTLHSFFKIPFKPLLPDDPDFVPRRIRKTLRYPSEKVKLIKELDLIIIDEISMVRADIIDFIDKVLKIYSGNLREPFGGKQLLFVGDIFQLEPVVTRDMRDILQRYYKQFFFFNAHVFNDLGLIPIELRKIYRQTDSHFISLLDDVRINHATQGDIKLINSRYNPDYDDSGEFVITLATRRDTVDSINVEHINAIKSPEFTFIGEISGVFNDTDLPTSKNLILKKDAQIIFIHNDINGRWVNGTIGKINEIDEENINVILENGSSYNLAPEMWENIQYVYDEKKKAIIENVLGTFTQFPIKLAWALTVHKSQGLSFNKIIIDFEGGAFTSGQTYVALSRCTSLEGITLLRPLSERDIIVNTAIVDFSREFNNKKAIDDAVNLERASDLYKNSLHAFNHNDYRSCVEFFYEAMQINNLINDQLCRRFISSKLSKFISASEKIKNLERIIDEKDKMLQRLASEYVSMGDQALGYGSLAGEDSADYNGKSNNKIDEIIIKSALSNYDKAISIDSNCAEAHIGKARLFIIIDEHNMAKKEFLKAIEINKKCYDAHMGIAELYSKESNITEAIKSYKRAAASSKNKPDPHIELANIYNKLGLEDLADEQNDIAARLSKNTKRNKRRQ
jgi:Tfp pilus assembly protein PilF